MAEKRGISGRALGRKGNPLGSPPFILHASVSTSSVELCSNLGFKIRVVDAWAVATDAACGIVTFTDGTTTIGQTVAMAGDTDIGRADELDDSVYEIGATGKIAATSASGTGELYVLCVRI